MKSVALVAFDRFTDIDLFLAWDLFSRVEIPGWRVQIVAPTARITSSTGLTIDRHAPLSAANEADAVYFVSGRGARALADDPAFVETLQLDESRQILAAVDSGAILLARLGHLRGRKATTYPTPDLHERLMAEGVEVVDQALVIEGNVATAAQCLAGVDLARWMIMRLTDVATADRVIASVAPLPLPPG
jgi:transcriptional regulator GlxA family with amidase domain